MFIRNNKPWKNERPAPAPRTHTENGESYRLAIHSSAIVRLKTSCANTLPGAIGRPIRQAVSQLIRRRQRLGFDGSAELGFSRLFGRRACYWLDVRPDALPSPGRGSQGG